MFTEATKNLKSGEYIFGNEPAEILDLGITIYLEHGLKKAIKPEEKKFVDF
jgi:hypothetical protein